MHLQVYLEDIECICDDFYLDNESNSSSKSMPFFLDTFESVTNPNICYSQHKYLRAACEVGFQLNPISRLFDQHKPPGFTNLFKPGVSTMISVGFWNLNIYTSMFVEVDWFSYRTDIYWNIFELRYLWSFYVETW